MEIKIKQEYVHTDGDQMIRWRAAFDGCSPTLEEFVNWILKENPMEYGAICNSDDFFIEYVEYKYGKVVSVDGSYEELKDKKIILTTMVGGWTAMDYAIKFE